MALQYLLELLRARSQPSINTLQLSFSLIFILIWAFISILICECALALYIFEEIILRYGASLSEAALLIAGAFLIQAILLLIGANFIVKRATNRSHSSTYGLAKNTISAFLRGFQNKPL